MQSPGYNIELWTLKTCNLHCFEEYDSGKRRPGACSLSEEDQKKQGGVVVSEPETKEYKVVFKKLRLMDNLDSLPYRYA